jgi:hypothetical protein
MTILMMAFPALVVDLPKQSRSWGNLPNILLPDVLLIVGVGAGLMVLLALGIYLWKRRAPKRRRHISSGEKVYRGKDGEAAESQLEDEEGEEEEEDSKHHSHSSGSSGSGGRRRYKYRARRRTHRTRNPTLSETGGLPPVKPHESGKPC